MGNFSHSNLVAGTGVVVAKDLNVYTTSPNKRNMYTIKTGDLVMYDPKSGTTYDNTNVATATNVRIGVGVGKKGQLADNIRLLNRDTFKFNAAGTTNDSLYVKDVVSACAQTAIMDVYFCGADCNQTVSINIEADTPVLRQYMPENEIAKYSFSAVSDCGCETCNGDADMGSIVDQLVDKINGSFRKARYDQFFAGNNELDLIQPFSAARIWTSGSVPSGKAAVSKYFEFNFDQTTNCETCNATIEKIVGMKFATGGALTSFTGVNDGTYTYVDQLQSVAEQITNKLNSTAGYSGHSYVSKVTGTSACCTYRIYVNAMVPTGETVIIWAGATPANNAGTNTSWTTQTDYGIRLFLDPIDLNFEENYPPQQFFPTLYQSIGVAGFTGFGCCNPTVISRQDATIPEGLGYLYVQKEIEQHNGGRGRNFFYDSPSMGLRGLPDASTAYANTTIDAKKNYKVWSFLYSRNTASDMVPGSPVIGYTDEFKLLIPTGAAGLSSVASYITAFAAKFKG
jgi:hypothetical protein